MIRIERHPLVRLDLRQMVRHVAEGSGDKRAAFRRLDEVEATLADIASNPGSGPYFSGLSGWRVRHGGQGRMITIVFRMVEARMRLQVPVVGFGGQDWLSRAALRKAFFESE